MNDTTREVGSALGIAVMGSVFSSRYRAGLPDLQHLPAHAAEAVHHSAAAGLQAAAHLGPQGPQLAQAVRDAFLDGFTAATGVAAAILALAALGALIRAPHRLPGLPSPAAGTDAPDAATAPEDRATRQAVAGHADATPVVHTPDER